MESADVRAFWEANAEAWIRLSRAGYDVCRDRVNTPAFLRMLPDVHGLVGIDIGCGDGHNTRLVAHRGARLTGIDIATTFLQAAIEVERAEPRGIRYRLGDAEALPGHDGSYDFATAFMSLMDVAHPERAIQEAARVIRPGGFLQFSIIHPCFQTRQTELVRNAAGEVDGITARDYFDGVDGEVEAWSFNAAPAELQDGPFRIPRFPRTLAAWMNAVSEAGLTVEHVEEPRADEEAVREEPTLQAARAVALFLLVRARKPQK